MSSPANQSPFPFRLHFPPELPISARAEEITAAIQTHQVVILAGETGSGKTTQIPKMCLAAGRGARGRIACTQPRRVAALSISRRVAEELDVKWGREVGCKIRFNDETTRETVIKFLTDGMLLAEVQGDPMLRDYDTIIIDEAHERSLNIDFLLGHLRTLRYKRPELKIVITSATIDTQMFSAAFDDAPVIKVEGRTYPVEVIYAPLDSLGSDAAEGDEREAKSEALHYIDGAVEAVERIIRESTAGDILVFMPSERDIREASDLLTGRRLRDCELVPLFGRLSNAEQQRVFAATQRRKIVVATNIAETSLTIPGIRFVVDTGLARLSRYSPQARTRRLPIEPVAQSSADQRKGRCGRVADGVCIRLYSEKDYLERPRFTQPEIQRANLADVILRMKAFGLGDIERFPFINMPAAKSIRAGYALLEELGAIEETHAGNTAAPETPSRIERARTELPRAKPDPAAKTPGETPPAPAEKCHLIDDTSKNAPGAGKGNFAADSGGIRQLTAMGRELARLPVDPTVGRMILQAREERALREVLVIAAGLSVQDPRDRPLDKQQQADAAHRRFAHPDSDFLTLLKIWDAYHDEFETMSQAKLRRFCRDHFLSYTRMREWRDVYAQLLDTLEQRDEFRLTSVFDGNSGARDGARGLANSSAKADPANGGGRGRAHLPPQDPLAFGTPPYRAIHRSILAGLLGNIAHLDEENGNYKATHDRRVALFPGSVLFKREEPPKRGDSSSRSSSKKTSKLPRWIMAAEMMETTRLYARTGARLDPAWALDLGAHLVRISHSEPFWNGEGGRVMVKQRTRLYGLELETRAVSYGKINPAEATEIFIREGLVNDTITFPLDFIAHNRKVREEIESLLTRTRDSGYLNLDEAAYRFYATQLSPNADRPFGVSSVAELVDLVRERRANEPRFLTMEPEDLRDPESIAVDPQAFPAELPLENSALPLNYAYKPGQMDDGVTLEVNVREAEALTPTALDWAVPGHLEAKVEHYLRALPKDLRVQLASRMPLAENAKNLAIHLAQRDRLTGRRESLTEALAAEVRERFRVAVTPALWADKPLPDHLRVRVRVVNDSGAELAASRELADIHQALQARKREASATIARDEPEVWRRARAKWEKPEQTAWTFGDIPARVLVAEQSGVPVYAFPGLRGGAGGVALLLFKTSEEAQAATARGLASLLERQLGHDLGWLERDLKALRNLGALTATLAPMEELQAQAFDAIRRWLCDPARCRFFAFSAVAPNPSRDSKEADDGKRFDLTAAGFAAALEKSKSDLRGLVPRFVDLLREILSMRQELLVLAKPYPGLGTDLADLITPNFLRAIPYERLGEIPRYLKAMKLRAERGRQNPVKDAERAAQLAPFVKAAQHLSRDSPANVDHAQQDFRWLVEEFRVSLFAQELGTAEPVSAIKLERALAAIAGGKTRLASSKIAALAPAPTPPPKPASAVLPLATEKKTAPLKNLGALDKLFPR